MKSLEAWRIISQEIDELSRLRQEYYPFTPGYSKEEITAQVMCFEALRRIEEENEQ